MANIIDAISVGNNNIFPIIENESPPVDLLGRQEIVDRICTLLDIVSEKKGNCTYALNGKWGTGKTFVLNMLRRQLIECQDGGKYMVFHYNCWQYDYYDEPLTAIVASMLDSIDEENHILPSGVCEAFDKGVEIAMPILKEVAINLVKNKIGVDIRAVTNEVENTLLSSPTSEQEQFDNHYAFKRAITDAQRKLQEMANNRTLVIVVDELDRCLPQYAIRVLERLHHLFTGVENCVVILAVDKEQLGGTIKQIFGEDTSPDNYLRKFINFEISLNTGQISRDFREKYAEYYAFFDDSIIGADFEFDKFFSALFAGIDMRSLERLMERITVVHKTLFGNEKKDLSFMCFELMWLVFTQVNEMRNKMPIHFDQEEFSLDKDAFRDYSGNRPYTLTPFSEYIRTNWSNITFQIQRDLFDRKTILQFSNEIRIPQRLIWFAQKMCSNSSIAYSFPSGYKDTKNCEAYINEFKKIDELLKIIH